MSVVATRVAAREIQASKSASSTTRTTNNGGREEVDLPKNDISWYTYDKSVMQDILSRETVFDVNSASLVRREDRDCQTKTTSLAEIINFSVQHDKMQQTISSAQ